MIKLLHAADLHLDSPLATCGVDARQRRAELRNTARRIFELARQETVDMLLLAGDLFDNDSPFLGTVELLKELCGSAGVPVFISPGNHDWYSEGSPYASTGWPENVHIFKKPEMEQVRLDGLGCSVWSCAFTSPWRDDRPLQGFSVPRGEDVNIVLLHGEVTASASRYGAVLPGEIASCGADYTALGHVHSFSGMRTEGGCCYAWPGCPEGRGFDETGDKGVIIAHVDNGRTDTRFVRTASRRYFDLKADAGGSALPVEKLNSVLSETEEGDICRVELTGSSPGIDLETLKLAMGDRGRLLRLRDSTVPGDERWERSDEDTLR
ncbi:MAG: DNA repair exonuclease [Oscillospiraceae bacterium]|nr:DNA repair exonuclease [Oscillospiraceae bacterium]